MALTITKVEPADQFGTVTDAAITNIPEPSTYVWSKHDISGQEAGRTITSDAWKNKKAEARSIRMTWNNKDGSVISQVFQAFNHEYMWVTYLDALTVGMLNMLIENMLVDDDGNLFPATRVLLQRKDLCGGVVMVSALVDRQTGEVLGKG